MHHHLQVPHFENVDIPNIQSLFFEDRGHRAYLRVPLLGERGAESLCVIGQNPSTADEHFADKTIHYLEKLIFFKHNKYRELIILNLYSQVDTNKSKLSNPLHTECGKIFKEIVERESDFLVVYGALTNTKPYYFRDRARDIQSYFQGKSVYKLAIDTPYAPHPGNSKIVYNNFDIGLTPYSFSDVDESRI
jgi:hypothetical protein